MPAPSVRSAPWRCFLTFGMRALRVYMRVFWRVRIPDRRVGCDCAYTRTQTYSMASPHACTDTFAQTQTA
eukprot:11122061-Alexandrium_andersonii.AAC.1